MRTLRLSCALALAVALCAATSATARTAPARARAHPTAPSPTLSVVPTHSPRGNYPVADNRLLVRFKGALTAEKLKRVYASADTSSGAVSIVRGDTLAWRIPASTTSSGFAAALNRTGLVAYAEPNYVRQLAGYTPPSYSEPNDPAYRDPYVWGYTDSYGGWNQKYPYGKSWWIRSVGAVSSWKMGYTGSNVVGKYPLRASGTAFKVAVLDTGFYWKHPDAGRNIIAGSADTAPVKPSAAHGSNLDERIAYVSHGTCVAGEVGAAVGNGRGTLGLANDTKVVVYKIYFGGDGIADKDTIAAIRRAADNGCKVINMSLAGGPSNRALQDAIDYAWKKGCIIVAASGNDHASTVSYPAAMNHVVAVGALGLGSDGTSMIHPSFSNRGSALDISAPGAFIWGLTQPGYDTFDNVNNNDRSPGYMWWDGTSMASPIVAGGIAWLWRLAPSLTNTQMVELIENTATDLGSAGRDNTYGYGAFNMLSAYNKLVAEYPLLLAPSTMSVIPASSGITAQVDWSAVSGTSVTYDVWVDGTLAHQGVAATECAVDLVPHMTSLHYYRRQLLWTHSSADGSHVVTIDPRSPLNWTDGSQQRSFSFTVPQAGPHVDHVSIDGGASVEASHGVISVTGLGLGKHRASVWVTDGNGNRGPTSTLTFTVRPLPTVKRYASANRFAYAAAASRTAFASASRVVLASGASWPDALAAAPLAHQVGGPVLLSAKTSVPAETLTELKRLKTKQVIVVGDTGSIAGSVMAYLQSKHFSVYRIAGSGHSATANAVARSIAKRNGGTPKDRRAIVVRMNYAEALPASAVAARKGWPLLYTDKAVVPASVRKTLSAIHVTNTLVVGNTSSVSNAAKAMLPSATRIGAGTALGTAGALANWATGHYPADFSDGEQICLTSSSKWPTGLTLGATAGRFGWLVLTTPYSLATETRNYYSAHSEIAVTTRVISGSSVISNAAVGTIRAIVGAL